MDLDPFEPVGIAASTMHFLDSFLLHCLLAESPPDSPQEIAALARNQHRTASRGREPGLMLERDGREVRLVDWAAEILEACAPIAAALDAADGGDSHRQALAAAQGGLAQPDGLPSARVLQAVRGEAAGSYTRFIRGRAEAIRSELLALPLAEDTAQCYAAMARESLDEQQRIEVADEMPFEEFRQRYVAAEGLIA